MRGRDVTTGRFISIREPKTGSLVRWYGDGLLETIRKRQIQRMHRAVALLKKKTRVNLNRHKTRTQGPSQKGDVPHVDTGILRDSIFWRVHPGKYVITGDVGTKLDYGIHHELTGRSFLRTTFQEQSRMMAAILGRENIVGRLAVTSEG